MDIRTVHELLDRVRELCAKQGLAPSTVKKRVGFLEKLFKGINEFTVRAIRNWIDSYVSERTGAPLGPHGKNNYIIAVKWFLKRYEKASIPQEELDKLKKFKPALKGRYIENDELDAILSYSPTSVHELAFRLVHETGIRPLELLSITTEHVEEQGGGGLPGKDTR